MAKNTTTQSYRAERDNKNEKIIRHSVIFTWQTDEQEDPFPEVLPLLIGGKLKSYKKED